jgi:hypothetical protein
VRGELRARCGDLSGAEQDFRAATELAERQSALSWRLRVATSAARLATTGAAATRALSDLRQTLTRFSEGADTADLRVAREFLEAHPQAASY